MKHSYLHRVSTDTATSNRNSQTGPSCTWLWPNDTGDSSGNQCDEFPYAASWERWNPKYGGAIVTNAGYSLCPIPRTHNRDAGILSGDFLTKERLLVGDPFYIKFKADPPNPTKCISPVSGRNVIGGPGR